MNADLGLLFRALMIATWLGVPLLTWRARGRTFGTFALVLLSLSLPGAWVTDARLESWLPAPWLGTARGALVWGVAAAALHLVHLIRARLRGRPFRLLVSVPGQVFVASSFLAGPWQLLLFTLRVGLEALGQAPLAHALRGLDLLPYAVGVISIATSARRPTEWVRLPLGGHGPPSLERIAVERRRARPSGLSSALRVVQISDPHLGPWQSVRALRRTLDELLSHDPHLVLLTGDFLTMEGNGTRGALADALAPLSRLPGRCFAIFGNHDHEAPEEVRGALAANGVRLLVDEEALVDTPVGRVQILGADHVWRDRREHLRALLTRHPRREGFLRLLLLHDPSRFRFVEDGEVDLTLSGHTHGGQVGLVSLGLDWTVLQGSRWPDHGLFARGASRLYVHRGTGFYGFPLRVGVPGEASVLELVWD